MTQEDVLSAIKAITSQAVGADGISIKMLSLVVPFCCEYITNIFNEMIRDSIFPKLWKNANIRPISKVASPNAFGDLRPISILPAISKVFEKLVAAQIKSYLESNHVLPEIQSGFRKSHGTHTALLKVLNDIVVATDKSLLTFLVLLDQSKAFDLVNHELLIAKLKYIGFGSAACDWVSSYLTDRYQRVVISNTDCSNLEAIRAGVPQGSILGPLFFSVYIFDIHKMLHCADVHLYADDIQVYYSFQLKDFKQAIDLMNIELDSIANFCEKHGLRLNHGKTKALCIGPSRRHSNQPNQLNLSLCIKSESIEWVTSVKNLGIVIDNKLSFDDQIQHVCRVTMWKLKSLYSFKKFLSSDVKLKLVQSLIYPHIFYCGFIYYDFLPQYNKLRLQRIQNACIRFVCNIPYRNHVTPYIKNICEMKVHNRMYYLYAVFLYKLLHTGVPVYLFVLLRRRSDVHSVNIRTDSFTVPPHHTNRFRGCFCYCAPVLLNKFLEYLNLSLSQFKSAVRSLLLVDY